MISLIRSPYLVFANNVAAFKFKKRQILDTVGGYARLYMMINESTPPATGTFLMLKKDGNPFITFNLSGSLTDDPTDLPYFIVDFDLFSKQFAQQLYNHPLIAKDYTVERLSYNAGTGDAVISFIARKRGIAYSLEIDGTTTMDYNVGSTVTTAGIDDVLLEDYKLAITAETISDAIYEPAIERTENIEVTGKANVDTDELTLELHEVPALGKSYMAQDIADNFFMPLPYRFNFVALALEVVEMVANEGLKTYQCNFDGGRYQSILAAGMPMTHSPYFDSFLSWAFLGDVKFLNLTVSDNRQKLTDLECPEFLNIYSDALPQNYIQRFTVYYRDGSNDIYDLSLSRIIMPYGYILRLPSGWANVRSLRAMHSDREPIKYEVCLVDTDSNIITETFTYVIDSRSFKQKRYFVYKNSLGVFDTLRVVGVNDFSIKRAGERVTKAINYDTSTTTGSIEMVYNERDELFTMRTGWMLNQAEKDLLTDFLQSTYVVEVISPLIPNKIVPDVHTNRSYFVQPTRACDVLAESTDMWTEDAGTWSGEFKMRYAHVEKNYFNGPRPLIAWYDTIIEFTVHIIELVPDTDQVVEISLGANSSFIWEGKNRSWTGVYTWPGVTGKFYYFRVEASQCTSFAINLNGLIGNIDITKISSSTLSEIYFTGFGTVRADYFKKRIETLWSLKILSVVGLYDPGIDINHILAALVSLWNRNPGVLTTAYFPNSTPDVIGYAMAAQLTSYGVGVTTL